MKKFLIFIFGVITGVALTFLYSYFVGTSSNDDVTWFESPGDIIQEESFEVFQVLDESSALVNGRSNHYGVVYLLVNEEGKFYYDDEIINVPNNKVVRQVGIYKYQTMRDNRIKTVPIIQIYNK